MSRQWVRLQTYAAHGAQYTINDTGWHHVAVVGDGNNIKFYVDGIQDGSSTPLTVFSSGDAAFSAFIGGSRVGTGALSSGMNGAIDELNIFNRVLTQEEIQGLAAKKSIEEVEFENTVTGKYRFGYQGQFAEKDDETGWNHFELREFDPVIGRWTTIDSYGEFWSPYTGMGNDPVNSVDPDGGCTSCVASAAQNFVQNHDFQFRVQMGYGGPMLEEVAVTPNSFRALWEDGGALV